MVGISGVRGIVWESLIPESLTRRSFLKAAGLGAAALATERSLNTVARGLE